VNRGSTVYMYDIGRLRVKKKSCVLLICLRLKKKILKLLYRTVYCLCIFMVVSPWEVLEQKCYAFLTGGPCVTCLDLTCNPNSMQFPTRSTATKDISHVMEPLGSFQYSLPCAEQDDTSLLGFIQIHF
jgi:hypothetical protein